MRHFALILLIPLTICAQQAGRGGRGGANLPPDPSQTTGQTPAPPAPTPAADLATLEGQVMNAIGGTPLRKAVLTLDRVNNTPNDKGIRANYSANTDALGHFAITGIEPGRYRLSATHVGFLSMGYNARRPGGNSTPLDFDRAQKVSVQFKLTPHGVVSGKITDEDGDPLQQVQVQLMGQVYNQGRKDFQQSGNAITNDLGEYRISGILPGKYYIAARRNNGLPTVQATQEQEDFVTTYYPNATDISAAGAIDMGPGDQVDGMNLHLAKVRTVHIKGRVANNSALPAPARPQTVVSENGEINMIGPGAALPMVRLIPRNNVNMAASLLNAPSRPDGAFEFPSVAPGAYTLIAVSSQGNKIHGAHQSLDVGGSNIEGLSLSINPGVTVTGHLHYDADPPQHQPSFMVRLVPRTILIGLPAPPAVKVDADGNFHFDDVDAELYDVNVNTVPQTLYLKSMRAGNTDVLLSGLDVSNGAGSLDILLGATPPQVTAVTVVLIPQEKERKGLSLFYSTTSTDQYGNFTFNRVMPGDYKVYAWEDIQYGLYYDPDFMKDYDSKGESVTAKEATPANVKLTMIPAK
jgi:protocatechuate 3,4-dioxygenase beta subunit